MNKEELPKEANLAPMHKISRRISRESHSSTFASLRQKKEMTHRRQDYQSAMQPYINNMLSLLSINKLKCNEKNQVSVNLNGTVFTLPRETCMHIPAIRKALRERRRSRAMWPLKNMNELFYERNASAFAAVVDYVQNKELHAPLDLCPRLFAYELTLWGFDVDELQPCCFGVVVNFLYEQERLKRFQGFLHKSRDATWFFSTSFSSTDQSRWRQIRMKMWNMLDDPFSSKPAQAYFTFMIVIVLLNFFCIAAGTHSYFHVQNAARFSNNDTSFHISRTVIYTEHCSIGLLYLDYALRIIFFPDLRYFLLNIVNITDGLSNLSSTVKIVVEWTLGMQRSAHLPFYLHVADMIQLLRMLHLLRPMSKMTGFRLIYYTVLCSIRELTLVLMLLAFLTMFFSSLLYYLGRTSFTSIPTAMWFTVITMTTVGYGDVIPTDVWSMIIGSVVAVFGVIMMSMTTPIMVSNFHALYINAVVGEPSNVKKVCKVNSSTSLAATFSHTNKARCHSSTSVDPFRQHKADEHTRMSIARVLPKPNIISFGRVRRYGMVESNKLHSPKKKSIVSFEDEVVVTVPEKRRRRCSNCCYDVLNRATGRGTPRVRPGSQASGAVPAVSQSSTRVAPQVDILEATSSLTFASQELPCAERKEDSSADTSSTRKRLHTLEVPEVWDLNTTEAAQEDEPEPTVWQTKFVTPVIELQEPGQKPQIIRMPRIKKHAVTPAKSLAVDPHVTADSASALEESDDLESSGGNDADDSETYLSEEKVTFSEEELNYRNRFRESAKKSIRPRYRSWYANYEHADSSDSEMSSGWYYKSQNDADDESGDADVSTESRESTKDEAGRKTKAGESSKSEFG